MALTTAPDRIPGADDETIIILAQTIELPSVAYSRRLGTAPRNVIAVADTLILRGSTTFDLAAPPGSASREPGSLVLIARHLELESKGSVSLFSITLPPFAQTSMTRAAGDLLAFVETVTASPERQGIILGIVLSEPTTLLPGTVGENLNGAQIAAIAALAHRAYADQAGADAFIRLVRARSTYDTDLVDMVLALRQKVAWSAIANNPSGLLSRFVVKNIQPKDIGRPDLEGGKLTISPTVQTIYQQEPLTQYAHSVWIVTYFEMLLTQIRDAVRQGRQGIVAELFREVASFPAYPIASSLSTRYGAVMDKLSEVQRQTILPLRAESLSVYPTPLSERRVTLFTEGASAEVRLAPTTILLSETNVAGKPMLGFLKITQGNGGVTVTYYLNGQLRVDPLLAYLSRKPIEDSKRVLVGSFPQWELSGHLAPVPGLDAAAGRVNVTGDLISFALALDRSLGDLALLQLASPTGLDLDLTWQYLGNREIQGHLGDLRLSATRRAETRLVVSGGLLSNAGRQAVQVGYVRLSPTEFEILSTPLRVEAGSSVRMPEHWTLGGRIPEIPPDAVSLPDLEPSSLRQEVHLLGESELAEEVVVTNSLPVADITSAAALVRVEVSVTYRVSGQPNSTQSTRLVLAPMPLEGFRKSFWVARSGNAVGEFEVQGTAYYADGGWSTLKGATFQTPAISITKGMLPR